MISRKPLTKENNNLNIKPAPIKPYSLLSFGLKNLPGQPLNYRKQQNQKLNHLKTSVTLTFNKENHQMNTHYIPQSKSIQSFPKIEKNQNLAFKMMNDLTSIQLYANNNSTSVDDDGIVQKSSFIRLQNITNEMVSEDQQIEIKKDQKYQFSVISQNYISEHVSDQILSMKNSNLYVDMKKKIKKLSKSKLLHRKRQTNLKNMYQIGLLSSKTEIHDNPRQLHQQLILNAYRDAQVFVDSQIYRNRLIPQRIDNDIDTDDEQVNAGIKRLKKSLEDVAKENLIWEREKQKIVNNIEDLEYQYDINNQQPYQNQQLQYL